MELASLCLKKNEDRRLRAGHLWIYSNEIDTKKTPLKNFQPGQEVRVEAHDKTPIGIAYVNPHSLISARLISRNIDERFDLVLLTKKIKIAYAWRQQVYAKPFYRLIFGESDDLPGLVVDRFGAHLVVQINTAGMENKKDSVIDALKTVLPDVQSILLRNDSSMRTHEGLESYVSAAFGTPPAQVLLEENDATFQTSLWEGQKTGWFYDHRLNRSRLKNYVVDQRVLDVFSYLGGWGIQAAKWGAREVLCLDASAAATQTILENAKLNHVEDKVKVICDDAFDGLKELQKNQEMFDVIILDPPAFVKKLKDKKEGSMAYQRINAAALKLLKSGGLLFSCSCSMHMGYEDLLQAIRRASLYVQCDVQMVERGHQGPDHPVHMAIPETDYLKMVVVRKMR